MMIIIIDIIFYIIVIIILIMMMISMMILFTLLRTKDSLRRSYLNEKNFRQFLTIPAFPARPYICDKDFPVLQLG